MCLAFLRYSALMWFFHSIPFFLYMYPNIWLNCTVLFDVNTHAMLLSSLLHCCILLIISPYYLWTIYRSGNLRCHGLDKIRHAVEWQVKVNYFSTNYMHWSEPVTTCLLRELSQNYKPVLQQKKSAKWTAKEGEEERNLSSISLSPPKCVVS